MRKEQWVGLALAVLSVLMVGVAVAQSDRGTIAGSVVDSTGAAVGGATVTAKDEATGSVYKTVSSPQGNYRLSDVAIGRYDITAEASGFMTALEQGVLVQINTVSALNITLQVGNVQQEVTVQADAPTLQTESSDIGTVVGQKQIEDLPLALNSTGQSFVRSPETFVFLTPGTAGPGTNSDHPAAGIYESKLSGGQNFGTEILLDGISVVRSDSGAAFDQTAPTVEALTEFKVTTSTPSAQFGWRRGRSGRNFHRRQSAEHASRQTGAPHYWYWRAQRANFRRARGLTAFLRRCPAGSADPGSDRPLIASAIPPHPATAAAHAVRSPPPRCTYVSRDSKSLD